MKFDAVKIIFLINGLLIVAALMTALRHTAHWQAPPPKLPVLSQSTAAQQLQNTSAGNYAAITERPLFWPSRRPPPPEVVQATQPVVDFLKNAELLGTFTSQQGGGAILRLSKKGKVIRIQQGETVNGLTLLAVNSVSAQFGSNGRTQTLMLTYAKQSDAPASPPRPAGAPTLEAQPAPPAQPIELPWVPVTQPNKK